MKVRICYTVEVGDLLRRGMKMHYGEPGLASRQDIKNWYEMFGESGNDDALWYAQNEHKKHEYEED